MTSRLECSRRLRFAIPISGGARCSAWALINANYTPVDLVRHSRTILRVELAVGERGSLEIGNPKTLKGPAPDRLALELDRSSPTVAKQVAKAVGEEKKPALLFLGDFSAASDATPPGGDTPVGLLHVDVKWFALKLDGGQLWILWRDASKGRNLCLSVSPATTAPGPVDVVGFDGKRCLGVQPSIPGARASFAGPPRVPSGCAGGPGMAAGRNVSCPSSNRRDSGCRSSFIPGNS